MNEGHSMNDRPSFDEWTVSFDERMNGGGNDKNCRSYFSDSFRFNLLSLQKAKGLFSNLEVEFQETVKKKAEQRTEQGEGRQEKVQESEYREHVRRENRLCKSLLNAKSKREIEDRVRHEEDKAIRRRVGSSCSVKNRKEP
eukprot:Gb_11888 [translate_table: standard]